MEKNKEIKEQKDKKFIQENNNIIFDLLLKNSKITTILNLILDYNNVNEDKIIEVILTSKEYQDIQDKIIYIVNLIHSIYKRLLGVQNEKK